MTDQPTEPDLRQALVQPGFELPSTVTKHRSVVMTRGLQPEDLGVLDYLKLRDPRRPATQEALAAEMQETLGWKMGKTRFAGIFQRLKAAGHIKHTSVYNPETGRPEWVIHFYMEPANNDQYVNSGITAFSQVNAESPVSRDSGLERPFGSPETSVSPGRKESQVSGDPEGNPWKPGIPSAAVSAGQSRNPENPVFGSPPHTPRREGGTTFPLPPTDKTEGATASPEELAAAVEFLMRLPGSWARSKSQAAKLAPTLIQQAAVMGWDLDMALRLWLIRNEPGKKPVENHAGALKWRIDNLVYREAAMTPVAEPRPAGATGTPAAGTDANPQSAVVGVPAWCGNCGDGIEAARFNPRFRTDTGAAAGVPCPDCHPASLAARQN